MPYTFSSLMDFSAFRQLSSVAQLYWTLKHGTYLAQRWSEAGGINLYHCADGGRGYFVEVGHNDGKGFATLLRSFVTTDLLEAYSQEMLLPQA